MTTDIIARGLAAQSIARTAAMPEDFGAVPDLNGNGGTDNTAAFQALASYINANGGNVILRGKYRITQGFPILRGTWEFIGDAVIRNTVNDNVNYWNNTCVFIGTYFGYGAANNGINTETGYDINPIAAGATQVSFVTASQAAVFPVGSLFFTTDANFYTVTGGGNSPFPKASHASVVVAITANGATKPQARTDAGGFVASDPGVPAGPAKFAKRVHIINGAFESANSANSQVVHFAGYECKLDFRWISGKDCVGANPVVDSQIWIRNAEYCNTLFELAYHHHRVDVPVLRGKRIGATASSTVAIVAISEYGNSVTIGDIDISDYRVAGDYAFRTSVYVVAPLTEIRSALIRSAQYCGLAIGSNGQRGELSRVGRVAILGCSGTTAFGGAYGRAVQIDADKVDIGTIEVDDLDPTGRGVSIISSSGDAIRLGHSRLGGGAGSGVQYRIVDARSTARRKTLGTMRGHYAQDKVEDIGFLSFASDTSGVDKTVKTYLVPAGTSGKRTKWDFRAFGNVPATVAAAARTVTLKLTVGGSTVTLASIAMTSAQSGFFNLAGTIRKADTDAQWDVQCRSDNGATAATSVTMNSGTTSMATNDLTLALILNTNTADSIKLREWSVLPSGDEAELI